MDCLLEITDVVAAAYAAIVNSSEIIRLTTVIKNNELLLQECTARPVGPNCQSSEQL